MRTLQTKMKNDFEPVYIYPGVLRFLRSWPDVPSDQMNMYVRAFEAGLIATPPGEEVGPGARWSTGPVLTKLGTDIKFLADGQSMNFFRLVDVLEPWGGEYIAVHGRGPGVFWNYCRVMQIDPRGDDVLRWAKTALRPEYLSSWIYKDKLVWLADGESPPALDLLSALRQAADLRQLNTAAFG